MSRLGLALCMSLVLPCIASSQSLFPRLLDAGVDSGLPMVVANDNRVPAGQLTDGILEIDLVVDWADWRPETDHGPGVKVAAVSEAGKSPTIPAPMIRVEEGTRIRATVHNALVDSSISVFGFYSRPHDGADSLLVLPGKTEVIEFEAGAIGTYFYWIQLGNGDYSVPGDFFPEEREQLAGAYIVDPVGGSPPDRVFVMNVFNKKVDATLHPYGYLDVLTINGRSWPYTERQRPEVGESQRWRIINSTVRGHPMHLHGFFYDVVSVGRRDRDDKYAPEEYRTVVTEHMRGMSTMVMEWTPQRPGNWLFHCHLSFHVAPETRLPGAAEANHDHPHMGGLVLGIEVPDGPSDLIFDGERRDITLYANEYATDSTNFFGFAFEPHTGDDLGDRIAPGPVMILQQYQPTYVTVVNNMSIPTGVHWHGLELDSWADGVPEWSASDGKMSPIIEPGEQFTYKLGLMRPGSFVYHSHLNDIEQLSGGLYGPLIVVPPGGTFDPSNDHILLAGWRTPDAQGRPTDFDLNGRDLTEEIPVQTAIVGETHRIRTMNIAPAGNFRGQMLFNGEVVPLKAYAKDGADLPDHQRVDVELTPRMGVGETADYTFTPLDAGEYELSFGYRGNLLWTQKWIVTEPE